MDGIHDMGGMHAFGPFVREAGEPVFHAEWERRMFALALAVPYAVPFNDDHLRREVERIPPADYLTAGYYELGLRAIETLLIERGVVTRRELNTGKAGRLPFSVSVEPPLPAGMIAEAVAAGASARRPAAGIRARFAPGDLVVARNIHPATHTRLPRYARGKRGAIERVHGVFSFNDSNSRGEGEQPQYVYSVAFTMRELWGPEGSATDRLYLDLWDAHLDSA